MKTDEAGIVISGRSWSASDFVRADGTPGPWTSKALEADPLSFEAELGRFLTELFSPGAAVTVHTSGSTGAPKAFAAEKSRMRASARATIAFLRLKPGCTNLLAMPLRFIAGKMVVVRSVECGLNLIPVEPCANPFLEHREAVDLCALTPMQAATVLANPATSRFLLESRAVILGGGPVDEELTAKLQSAQGAVYASYGMTETLSHVALRRLNGPTADAGFRALPGVTISLSALNTLQIEAPAVAAQTLITHDRARFNPDGTFLTSWDEKEYFHYRPLLSASYARILSAKNNPAEMICDLVREHSRIYPRPVTIGTFQEEPFNLKPEELQDLMQSFPKDPKKSDIKFTTSSLGTVFLYSNKYLEDDYADFLAQYLDVDQVMSP